MIKDDKTAGDNAVENENDMSDKSKRNNSFTLQKFYEKNKDKMNTDESSDVQKSGNSAPKEQQAQVQSGSELELTNPDSNSLPKREPIQVSSEEIDDNTELEQDKEMMRNELASQDAGEKETTDKDQQAEKVREEVEEKVREPSMSASSEDDEPLKK